MNSRTTAIMVAIAAVATLGALWMAPKDLPPPVYEDTGLPLFADFTDPHAAAGLEVLEWDETSAKLMRFKVEQKAGRWVIPSHHDYPADAAEHLGKAASSFIDVKRDIYYGDKPEEHGKFGVVDPESTEAEEGRGKRITLTDNTGTKLVDIIVGKEIPDKKGFLYVRFPEQKRVYGSRLELDVSTSFTDWIEKDLLMLTPDDVYSMNYNPYRVDERLGQVTKSEPLLVERELAVDGGNQASDWRLMAESKAPKGKELDSWKVQQMLSSIDNLQIVGVRPRPNPLTLAALQSKGFFVTMDTESPRLFGNEGEVSTATEDGIVYTLYFGEVTLDAGLALTAGTKAPEVPPTPDQGSAKDGDEAKDSANRYLFVDVTYDPAHDKAAQANPAAAEKPAAEKPAAEKPGDKPAEPEKADPAKEHKAQAAKLQKRFGAWFYVISDDSFKKIHKPREEYFKDPPKQDK